MKTISRVSSFALALFLSSPLVLPQERPIQLRVDATDAPRRILHASLTFPAKPGKLTLLYPKWIPGEHGPTGPLTDLAGLTLHANGKPLNWERDAVDLFAIQINVPEGAESVEASLDFFLAPSSGGFSSGASATPRLLVLSWNHVLLYPTGRSARDLSYAAELKLPAGWTFGSALPVQNQGTAAIQFAPVSLEQLIDSPLIAGAHLRTIDLAPELKPRHQVHFAADSHAALEMPGDFQAGLSRLIRETGALFGSRHYRDYHFLLALSDHIAHFGLEHHESSDNRTPERMLIDADLRNDWAGLLPHEIVHSWNGKYRRPSDIATPDFHQPMKTELLWVYEGLTTYLGELLTVRSGLWSEELHREALALVAAQLDHQAGRAWRPLSDTTVAAQLLYQARPDGRAWRRGVDFYPEGWLIWFETDVLIRQQTNGRKSLDDFCRRFFGGPDGSPRVKPYTFADLVAALNEIVEFDWTQFFRSRVYAVAPRAPLGGITGSGWRLVYHDRVPQYLTIKESADKMTDLTFSIGLNVKEDGTIGDVVPGLPAHSAGIGAGMKLIAVNGRRWTPAILRDALKSSKTSRVLELLVQNTDFFKTCTLSYDSGEKYPHLERDDSKPDLLTQILARQASDQ